MSREDIEAYLAAPGSAYRRLRLVMDAWCALWYWPLTTDVTPPSLTEWLGALEGLLGIAGKAGPTDAATFAEATAWDELELGGRLHGWHGHDVSSLLQSDHLGQGFGGALDVQK